MGCTQSKIENEEAVSRCKGRKQFMKDAVSARNAFAAAHSTYAVALKNTGAALSDYTHAEVAHHPSSSSSAAAAAVAAVAATTSSVDSLPPPPPPLPNFPPPASLQRAASMPEMKIPKPESKPVAPTIIEEEEMDFEAQDNEKLIRKRSSNNRGSGSSRGGVQENHHMEQGPPQPTPQQQQQPWKEEVTRPPTEHQGSFWSDYFFAPADSMPGPSLTEPVEEEEELRRKEFEENRVPQEEEEEEEQEPVVVEEKKVEKAVEVPVPVPVPAVEKKAVKKGSEVGRRAGKLMNFMQLFADLDDHFLRASESAHEVSKMLEATRLHYHSNFADNRGHIDHSKRVMRVITWNRSFKGIPSVDDGNDDFDTEEHETHATVLDKMLAWEKKLYDEVKAGEIMKFEYQRKVASLNKQKKRGSNPESLEKLKAAVSHLHTRYIVDMQSLDSTVAEINRLRDKQLYPRLVLLVDGMAKMWETMRVQHENQLKIADACRFLEISQTPKETTEYHYERTCQLCGVAQDWHKQLCKLIDNQKDYIKALNSWLKLNLIPIESNLKEKVSSPPRVQNPPIHALLIVWHDYLDKLPDEVARSAINNFAAVIQTIVHHQEEELKMRAKCEATRKELARKTKQFDDWKQKHIGVRMHDEVDPDRAEENPHKEAMTERQFFIDSLSKQLEEEEEACQKLSLQVREKSLNSLKTRLPELFRAMSDVARACSDMYNNLRSVARCQNTSQNS